MGQLNRDAATGDYTIVADESGNSVVGHAAWRAYYPTTRIETDAATGEEIVKGGWSTHKLKHKVGAFIDGGANFLSTIGIPLRLGVSIVAVLVACFAATTLDTATRLQRYVIQELASTAGLKPVTNKYIATAIAAGLGCIVALIPANPTAGPGSGGLILWPLFGAVNQLLAGLALLVTVFYLWRRSKPVLFALIPMLIMLVMPAWAMMWSMFAQDTGWFWKGDYLLFGFGAFIMCLQVWMVIEAVMILPRAKGVLEEALPPLTKEQQAAVASLGADARSC